MQDNCRESKRATEEVFAADVEDCSVHLERQLKKRAKTAGSRHVKGKTPWDNMRNDFNAIKNVPTQPLMIHCCLLFVLKCIALGQRKAAGYFLQHAFTFNWTRSQTGAGAPLPPRRLCRAFLEFGMGHVGRRGGIGWWRPCRQRHPRR